MTPPRIYLYDPLSCPGFSAESCPRSYIDLSVRTDDAHRSSNQRKQVRKRARAEGLYCILNLAIPRATEGWEMKDDLKPRVWFTLFWPYCSMSELIHCRNSHPLIVASLARQTAVSVEAKAPRWLSRTGDHLQQENISVGMRQSAWIEDAYLDRGVFEEYVA